MYGTRARASRPSAALVLAICMRDSTPSCIRAPPEQDTATNGIRRSSARSIARVTFSPRAEPMLPPMKSNSIAARLTAWPPMVAVPLRSASSMPVFFRAALSRSAYAFWSLNPNGSSDRRPASYSWNVSGSASSATRFDAPRRK